MFKLTKGKAPISLISVKGKWNIKKEQLSAPHILNLWETVVLLKKKVSTLNHDSPSVYKPRHKQLCHTINCYI